MKHLSAALAAIQNLFVVEKRNANSALGNAKYADYADIRTALDPRLQSAGLAFSFAPGAMRHDAGQWVQSLALTVWHVESGEQLSATGEFPLPEGNRGVNFAQRYGSALTYAMRYMLVAFFGIITGDDDDARRARAIQEQVGMDAPPRAADTAEWPSLMGGNWTDLAAPDGATALCELTDKERAVLWKSNQSHAGLMAWAGDRLYSHLDAMQILWREFTERAGGSWPENAADCTPEQLMRAVTTAKSMRGGQQ